LLKRSRTAGDGHATVWLAGGTKGGRHRPWSLIFGPVSLSFCPTFRAASLALSLVLSTTFLALSAALSMDCLILSLVSAIVFLLQGKDWSQYDCYRYNSGQF
jgi:hypothetical protein